MSLNRSEKEAVINEVTSLAAKAQTLVMAEYRGNIPSKEVLLAQLLGLMQSPISRTARVLAALAEKRGGGEAAPADAPAEAQAA